MKYTTILSLTIAFISGLTLSSCGHDGVDGLTGAQGASGPQGASGLNGNDGEDGDDGTDALAPVETIFLTPSRDYDPSSFFPESISLGAGIYSLPSELPLAVGVAGTGWASITVNDVRFCYQGNGVNNTVSGTAFRYKGAFELPGECFSKSLESIPLEGSSFFNNMEVAAEVHGGGVSAAIRTFTQVEANIKVRELN